MIYGLLDVPRPPAYNPSHSEVVRNCLSDRKEGLGCEPSQKRVAEVV